MVESIDRTSKLSKLLQCLVIFKILPIRIRWQKNSVSFRFLSMTTLAFVVVLILISLINMATSILIADIPKIWTNTVEEMKEMKLTDLLCLLSIFGMFQLYPIFPIIIGRGCQWMPSEVLLAKDLEWPKYGFLFLFSITSFSLEYSLFFIKKIFREDFLEA